MRSIGNSISSSSGRVEKSSDSKSGVVESSGFIKIVFLSMVLINYRVTGSIINSNVLVWYNVCTMFNTSLRRFVVWGVIVSLIAGLFPNSIASAEAGTAPVAELVSVTPAVALRSGDETIVKVAIRNIGKSSWSSTGDSAVKIATADPRDGQSSFYHSSWISSNRVAVFSAKKVKPGQTANFSFRVMAGGKPGLVTEKFGLVAEGVGWADMTFPVSLNISPATYTGQLTTLANIKLDMRAGESVALSTKLKNTGDAYWSNSGANGVKLATITPFDRTSGFRASDWLSGNRVGYAVAPTKASEEAEFKWNVQAPLKTGRYIEEFGFVAEGITWMTPKVVLEINVTPATYKAQWVRQSESVNLASGDTAELWVEFKNTGNTVWKADGSTPFRLGTANKLDRQSGFYDPSWITSNRVANISPAEVKPGEVGKFTFKVQASQPTGKYKEYFRPVIDNLTWLDDVGLYWDIKVEEGVAIQSLMRVGLTSTTSPIKISGESFVIRKSDDKTLVRKFSGGESVTITPSSKGYKLSTGEVVKDAVRVVPMSGAILTVDTSGISSNYNSFRGVIVIQKSVLGNVWVVNHLDLEDYMKGIAEVPESWAPEAQNAQVVAARTYGVKKRSESVTSDIFDVYDDTRHQVYYGYDYEAARPKLVAAVKATQGLVMKYGGQVISAYFFSDSGGATESSENVWGKGDPSQGLAYLRGVDDPYAKPLEWEVTLTQEYLKQRFDDDLQIASSGDEDIQNIEIEERFPSKRIKTAVFTLSSGRKVSVPFYRFDYLTNNNDIKSMRFEVKAQGSSSAPDFVFEGEGWGHGVGMPQWGARNMAEKGFDFRKILTYYYTGVNIEKL